MALITVAPGTLLQTLRRGFSSGNSHLDYPDTVPVISPALNPDAAAYRPLVLNGAVNEIGYQCIELAAHCGFEHPINYWQQFVDNPNTTTRANYRANRRITFNNNRDPAHFLVGGVDLRNEELDYDIVNWVNPFRALVQANGERAFVIAKYEAFTGTDTVNPPESNWIANYFHNDPLLMGRFAGSYVKYVHDTYGFWIDVWDFFTEPDFDNTFFSDFNGASPALVGNCIKAIADKFAAIGAPTVINAPSPTDPTHVSLYYAGIESVSGAEADVDEVSYHAYGRTPTSMAAIGALASSNAKGAMMTEHESSFGHQDLFEDLTVVKNTSWGLGNAMVLEAGTSAGYYSYLLDYGGGTPYPGANYPVRTGAPLISYQAKLLKRYFQKIRSGAQRIGASSNDANFQATAWRNLVSGPRQVVVVEQLTSGPISIVGLDAGTYAVRYSQTDGFGNEVALSNITIGTGATLTTPSIPAAAWVTIFDIVNVVSAPTTKTVLLLR
jgi:hypothetical protein